jgi:hypothetical protein
MTKVILLFKRQFRTIFKGRLAYFIYKLLYKYINKSEKTSDRYYKSKYEYHFLSGDLIKAISSRVKQMIFYEQSSNVYNKQGAQNYLDIIRDDNLTEILEISDFRKAYLKNRPKMNNLIGDSEANNINVLFLGPAFSPSSKISFSKYDYVVLNKPPINNGLKIPTKKIIIILNNQWSTGVFSDKTMLWIKNNDFSRIFTPNNLGLNNKNIIEFNNNFNYCSASPMGLQRALFLILKNIKPKNIDIHGYDFQLSDNPYNSWYPSGITFFYKDYYSGWLDSNMQHDFLFNFMFVKKIKQQYKQKITGSITPYLDMNIKEVIKLFEKKVHP